MSIIVGIIALAERAIGIDCVPDPIIMRNCVFSFDDFIFVRRMLSIAVVLSVDTNPICLIHARVIRALVCIGQAFSSA